MTTKPWYAAALLLGVAACAGGPAAVGQLTPARDRITDEAIAHDRRMFEAVEARLDALKSSARSSPYHDALARAWLDFARDEYDDNDRSSVVAEALAQAERQVDRMERGMAGAPLDSVLLIAGAGRARDDLWARVPALAADPGFAAAQVEVAQLQVELVRAGHVPPDGAACRAETHLQTAERLATDAEAKALAGRPRVAAPVAAVEMAPTRPVAPTAEPVVAMPSAPELEHLGGVVHFGFDSDSLTQMSIDVLDRVVSVLDRHTEIRLVLEGHTDPRGNDRYNQALSERRAAQVRSYLAMHGVAPERISARGYGKSRLLEIGQSARDHALNRRVDLIFQATDQLHIDAVRQEQDLQLESARPRQTAKTPTPSTPKPQTPKPARRKTAAPTSTTSVKAPAAASDRSHSARPSSAPAPR
jgi:outer membrane protein OmpA-like peptidoglycan-associated protein